VNGSDSRQAMTLLDSEHKSKTAEGADGEDPSDEGNDNTRQENDPQGKKQKRGKGRKT
jgi:hypothetical protein